MQHPNLEVFLGKLDGVRRFGKDYRARCPHHDSRRKDALVITDKGDGRILLKCFGGCSANDVVAAVGMKLTDLMPPKPERYSPEQRDDLKRQITMAEWGAALAVIDDESDVIAILAGKLSRGHALTESDAARLAKAKTLINEARMTLRAKRQAEAR